MTESPCSFFSDITRHGHGRVRLSSRALSATASLCLVGSLAAVTPLEGQTVFSPDGRRVLGLEDEGGWLFDVQTGSFVNLLERAGLTAAAFLPNGLHVITGDEDGTIQLWDVETGTVLYAGSLSGEVTGIAVSPDGSRAATASYEHLLSPTPLMIRSWNVDLRTGLTPGEDLGRYASLGALSFSSDGRRLLASIPGDSQLLILDGRTGAAIRSLRLVPDSSGIAKPFFEVVEESPASNLILTLEEDGVVQLWHIQTGALVRRIGQRLETGFQGAAFADDGRKVLTANGPTIHSWDVDSGAEVRRIRLKIEGLRTPTSIAGMKHTPRQGSANWRTTLCSVPPGEPGS